MSTAAHGTREEKLRWLLRPVEWASTLSFFTATFGFVYWYFEIYSAGTVALVLSAALTANAVLLIWACARIMNAARGRS
jgi:hypothetical protein